MSVTIYGIKNCDTMKKARAWLDKHGVDYAFHDYKTAGIERAQLEQWSKKVGWETLLNRAGTTFKKLPEQGERRHHAGKGDRPDAQAAVDDQTARPGGGWGEIAGRLQAGAVRSNIGLANGIEAAHLLAVSRGRALDPARFPCHMPLHEQADGYVRFDPGDPACG